MTVRIEQVASALGTLDGFALRTTERVQIMSEGLSAVASSGDVLARFASEAAAFVTSVEEGIDAVRRRAGETGDLARVVTSTAERGEALVNDSVQGMYRVEESIRRAAEIVEALGQRSQEIGRIVDVIQEVADQTNLLSLNAAIIAAQAGEHGLAFGVVAEEIRSLAERTARSTREIAAIVRQTRGTGGRRRHPRPGGPRARHRRRGAGRSRRLGAQGDPRHHPADLRRGRGDGGRDGAARGAGRARGAGLDPRGQPRRRAHPGLGGAGRGRAGSWSARPRRWPAWPRAPRPRPRVRRAPAGR